MYDCIEKELLDMQDLKFKNFHSKLVLSSSEEIIGVKIPVLRKYVKDLLEKYDREDLIKNIPENYYEEIMLKALLIGSNKTDFDKAIIEIKSFLPKINNWAVCDTFCAGLKITKKHKEEMFKFINSFLNSKHEYEKRFMLVMILDYYVEEEYLDRIFKIFEKIPKNDLYYVQMANAWAISICLIKYYDETYKFLLKADLDDFTYNKAIQKAIESYRISDDKKEVLRKLKR